MALNFETSGKLIVCFLVFSFSQQKQNLLLYYHLVNLVNNVVTFVGT